MGILSAMGFSSTDACRLVVKVLWKLCHGFSFPAEVITFHSYGDYCSVGYLAKYRHYTSQLDFCLSGTNAILYSMPYRRVILGYVQYCREEQNLILNSICSPRNALQCDKAVGEIQTIRPGGKKYDNLPKNVCSNFPLLMKFEYL